MMFDRPLIGPDSGGWVEHSSDLSNQVVVLCEQLQLYSLDTLVLLNVMWGVGKTKHNIYLKNW